MRIDSPPQTWNAPAWHPDWQPEVELEHLRSLAIELLARSAEARVVLDLAEEGLMCLQVELPGGATAEIHTFKDAGDDVRRRRYGVFVWPDSGESCEFQADAPEEAAVRLLERGHPAG